MVISAAFRNALRAAAGYLVVLVAITAPWQDSPEGRFIPLPDGLVLTEDGWMMNGVPARLAEFPFTLTGDPAPR